MELLMKALLNQIHKYMSYCQINTIALLREVLLNVKHLIALLRGVLLKAKHLIMV